MRLFAALVPPPDAVEDLADFLEPRREAGSDLRWADPHQWHITLAFMPHVSERAVDDLLDAVTQAAAGSHPAELEIRGGGAFPNPAEARVLWCGVGGRDAADLPTLARRVRLGASHAGAAPQGGPFNAHVTVARWRRPVEATRWLRVMESYAGPPWTAREVTVIASHLGEARGHRPRYEVLGTAALADGA